MAIDPNAFANSGGAQPMGNAPMSGQQPVTATNGIASMLKAMLDGNSQYKQGQATGGAGMPPSPMSSGSMVPGAAGPSSVGGAMGPAPLVDPNSLQGGLGASPSMSPPMGGVPSPMTGPQGAGIPNPAMPMSQGFPNSGTVPMSMDPVTNALMSPIPGM